jgi:hypothetical protein
MHLLLPSGPQASTNCAGWHCMPSWKHMLASHQREHGCAASEHVVDYHPQYDKFLQHDANTLWCAARVLMKHRIQSRSRRRQFSLERRCCSPLPWQAAFVGQTSQHSCCACPSLQACYFISYRYVPSNSVAWAISLLQVALLRADVARGARL